MAETSNIKIAVLSGKGGTGKTFAAVNLSYAIKKCTYIDCDVEEPNGGLFLKPVNTDDFPVTVKIPIIDGKKCTLCRKCVDFCRFNALCCAKSKILVFNEVCHSCGGCSLICPVNAVSETEKEIGNIEIGDSGNIRVISGILKPLETSGVPIIEKMLRLTDSARGVTVIDCPPGSGCAVMSCLQSADYVILVAEPTVFGAHNLDMVAKLTKMFDKRCGVILNKCDRERNPSKEYAEDNDLEILAEIPYDKKIARINSASEIAAAEIPSLMTVFDKVAAKIVSEAAV